MAKLSRAAVPLDLMEYAPEDEQPSLFWLREDRRQGMLAVFNFTEQPRSHKIPYAELQLAAGHSYQAFDVLAKDRSVALANGAVVVENQPPHSVRLLRIVNPAVAPAPPTITLTTPSTSTVGEPSRFTAAVDPHDVPALSFTWKFGDGTTATGPSVAHTYTAARDYRVELDVDGLDGLTAHKSAVVKAIGTIRTPFPLSESRRYNEP